MQFDPDLARIRFGTGLRPGQEHLSGMDDLLSDLVGPDTTGQDFPIAGFDTSSPSLAALTQVNRAEREARETPFAAAALEARQLVRGLIRPARIQTELAAFARAVDAPLGLRERLTFFWADHFTVTNRRFVTEHLVHAFAEDAIRPHLSGSFPQMLRAVVTHPMMLLYLDQARSIGPGSPAGQRRGVGLNENLARELLELHLIGAGGSYGQEDVRQLAELLTGLTFSPARGTYFAADRAEPGAETVLGRRFGPEASLDTVLTALDELAVLPQTARHLATKMAVHFIGPTPDPDLIATMANAFGPNGDLFAMTQAMLAHPAAWTPTKAKVRQPADFVVAALRALGVSGEAVAGFDTPTYRRVLRRPLVTMGQPWNRAPGPDGWPEDAESWVIPQGMAARINWAMRIPSMILDALPDPREFAKTALGSTLPEEVAFAAGAAERRRDGIGVVLASAAFQRR